MAHMGTLRELGERIVKSFKKLTPEQQEQFRKEMRETLIATKTDSAPHGRDNR